MQYTKLGWSGTKVSSICLGTMSFGNAADWMVEKEEAFKVLQKAWDLGINFYDTANVYSRGRSEEIVGEFMKGRREDAVIATKVFGRMGDLPNDAGLSRKQVLKSLSDSLRRLGTDYVDLYQLHRWDRDSPIEETLSTLTDAVHQGKVRYIGASSMWAYQLATAYYTAEMKGYERFVSMQDLYNLLYREEEREVIPFCKEHDIALIPWSPTAVGVLSGRYMRDGKLEIRPGDVSRLRPGGGDYRVYVEPPENAEIVRRVIETAKSKGVTPTQVALAWLLKKGVTAPIVATTKPEHVEEAVGALDVKLTDDEVKYLEEPYRPKAIYGHS
ncbi:MAG: aldo/keto reductase [TACK group archaeon]|nr:aldo/keto reductase [TACK group archaeon]